MHWKKILILTTALLGAGLGSLLWAQSDQYKRFLGVADIQKITGLKELQLVPKNADADGDLNFARPDGQIVVSVSFYPASAFASARSSRQGFKSVVQGVGEEAFVGPADGPPLYILAFRKGNYTVVLNTEIEARSGPRLSMEQMMAIGKLLASRM